MSEVKCGTTHYAGCACHEAAHKAQVAALHARVEKLEGALRVAEDSIECTEFEDDAEQVRVLTIIEEALKEA